MHFDELCLEPGDGKPNSNRNIIFTMCADDQIEQNWKYNEQVFLKNKKICFSF
jgi:hypothetical protein